MVRKIVASASTNGIFAKLLRRLGTRDASLIVMGGIIGSGIFMNPSVVARFVGSGSLVMLVWVAGGGIALLGAGIFAELAARRPDDGGLYAYLRDAFHPALAFIFGWTLLLVSQSGGMAAAAVTFAAYFSPLTGQQGSTAVIATSRSRLYAVNALGVRTGTLDAESLYGIKILAIAGFATIGLFVVRAPPLRPRHYRPETRRGPRACFGPRALRVQRMANV